MASFAATVLLASRTYCASWQWSPGVSRRWWNVPDSSQNGGGTRFLSAPEGDNNKINDVLLDTLAYTA